MTKADRIDKTSPDLKAELLARLKSVVPERGQSVNFGDALHVFFKGENLEVLKFL